MAIGTGPYTARVETSEGHPFSLYVRRALPEKLACVKAKELLCKHTWGKYEDLSDKARGLYDRTLGACQWSSDDGTEKDSKHLNVIDGMERDGYENAVRLVALPGLEGELVIDNLHTAIAWLRRFGVDATLADMPCYIVDVSSKEPFVLTDGRLFRDSVRECQGAVQAAMRYRPLRSVYWPDDLTENGMYRLGDFIRDHPELLEHT